MSNYEQLIAKISEYAKLNSDEIERRVEAKRAKLSGLVSKEGAAQIVAAELGINFDKERMKIAELVQGMKRANVLGKVVEIAPVREYNKNGRSGKVGRFTLADESSNVKVVLWDTNHINLIESNKLVLGSVIEISNANVRNGELHLNSFSDIKQSKQEMENVVTKKMFVTSKLGDVKPGESLKTRAFVVQVFDPHYFEVCPECRRKAVEGECKMHGKVNPIKRALLNVVLDDGTGTTRAVVVGENINLLGLEDEAVFSLEKFAEVKNALLGEEKIFSGNVRANQLYNTVEFSVEKIENVEVDELIKELSAKA
jgi:ssDNA-binding replication factor A large subunit